jgi:hypothetical protein
MDNIRTTSPNHKKRRTLERQRNISGSGATSIRSLGDQEVDPRTTPQGAHLFELITLWEPNHVGAEEIWDLLTLH